MNHVRNSPAKGGGGLRWSVRVLNNATFMETKTNKKKVQANKILLCSYKDKSVH